MDVQQRIPVNGSAEFGFIYLKDYNFKIGLIFF
jgi:hypothetical protein